MKPAPMTTMFCEASSRSRKMRASASVRSDRTPSSRCAFDRQRPLNAARRQHQLGKLQAGSRGKTQAALGAVDLDSPLAEREIDLVLRIEIVPAQENAVLRRRAFQKGLGERRPLIGKILLVTEKNDLFGKSFLAQRGGELHAAVARADDDNLIRTHPAFLNDPNLKAEGEGCAISAAPACGGVKRGAG